MESRNGCVTSPGLVTGTIKVVSVLQEVGVPMILCQALHLEGFA